MDDTPRMKSFATHAQISQSVERLQKVIKSLNTTGPGMLKEGMAEPYVLSKYPELKEQFEKGLAADSLLLMADLSPFSQVVANWDSEAIAAFLQEYYKRIVKKITDHNGVVEKYIGDAVIAAFGQPFEKETTLPRLFDVITLGQTLITDIYNEFGGEVSLKCAIAYGSCFYGYVGPPEHTELTIIGGTLTELFRLEDIAKADSIILATSLFDQVRKKFNIQPTSYFFSNNIKPQWYHKDTPETLRGVGNIDIHTITLNRDALTD